MTNTADFFSDRQVSDFQVGDRVALHPETDAHQRGDYFGVITKLNTKFVRVTLEKTGFNVGYRPYLIRKVGPPTSPGILGV